MTGAAMAHVGFGIFGNAPCVASNVTHPRLSMLADPSSVEEPMPRPAETLRGDR
jgi:hypothetical protein